MLFVQILVLNWYDYFERIGILQNFVFIYLLFYQFCGKIVYENYKIEGFLN